MLSIAEIKKILKQEHIAISKRRGQNFLVERQTQNRIINAIDVKSADEILEIGPGLGTLTEDLTRQAGKVIAVEKDAGLARISQRMLSRYKNLEILCQDILQFEIGKFTKKKLKVVGNLPYYITTPIIGYLLEKQRERIKDIFITVQNEVGRRILAKAGNKDYSALSLLVQYFAKPKLLFSLPKRAFYPQPKVDSVFLHLRILQKPQVKVNNQEQFFKIIRTCFNQRRKTIVNSLTHKIGKGKKSKIEQALKEVDIDSQIRPERLLLDQFAKIEGVFYKMGVRL